jgi:hypothetical protein
MSILSNHAVEVLDEMNGRVYGSDLQEDRPAAWDASPTDAEIDAMARDTQLAVPADLTGLESVVVRLRSVEADNRRWGNGQRADCYQLAARLVEEELARLQKPARRLEDFPRVARHACDAACNCQSFRNGD